MQTPNSGLFSPITFRSVSLRNRIVVSPMCQYSSTDGFANDWHFVHLGSRAIGGVGLIIVEASAVEPCGRITAWDLGIWSDDHIAPLRHITDFLHEYGSVAGIQIAHAGRKASTKRPWEGGAQIPPDQPNGWETVAPSPIAFSQSDAPPHELTLSEIRDIISKFAHASDRAHRAGFRVLEVHAAHGYLAHEFLSPLSNKRTDEYGGSFENRTRFLCEVVEAVRRRWPDDLPLFVRISATDWADGGWDLEQSVELARRLRRMGVDLIDCSSGGLVPYARIHAGSGYQTEFARAIRQQSEIATGAVGMITSPAQADHIIRTGQADVILMARAMLRDPYWPLHAVVKLGIEGPVPPQYERAFPTRRS